MTRDQPGEQLRVLVVAGESVPRAIVVRSAEHAGHAVHVASTGAAAWQALTTEDFDVVICESLLPDATALDLCRQARPLFPGRYIYFLVLTPHAEALHAAENVRQGADDSLFYPVDRTMLETRLLVAGRVMRLHHELYRQARSDALTGAANRLQFVEDIRVMIDRTQRYGEPFSLIACDIDNFKRYNDSRGHQMGDEALRAVARALHDTVRSSDKVYRFGGEEFVLLLPRQDLVAAAATADRVRKRVQGLHIAHEGNVPWGVVTISLGVSFYAPGELREVDAILCEADAALYRAKARGRNCVVLVGDAEPVPLDASREPKGGLSDGGRATAP